ncbi:MAG: hypothetical protein ACRCXC_05865 [Legionella sp.]
MSRKGEEDSAFQPLAFLLAIAGRIDAQSRILAEKLDKGRYIYHAYSVLDSLSSSYSMFKYFLEVFLATNNPDDIHDILNSPEGIAAVSAEAIFLVAFSLLASVFDGEEKYATKKFIASAWPFFRDVMKGLKNAYKGWRSTVQILSLLSGVELKYMVVPVGLVLGILAAANRFWLRDVVERRKKQMDIHKDLLLKIEELTSFTDIDREFYFSQIKGQDEKELIRSFFAVAAGGLIDGLYLYAGVVSLSVLSPPLFIEMTAISAFYTLACVVTRIYEEYDFQLRLLITQTKCKFALVSKELQCTYATLLALQQKMEKTPRDLEEIKRLKLEVSRLIKEFEALRNLLKEQTTHSYFTAGLLGMKYGLYAYGSLTSVLFMVSTVFLVTAATFPPALLAGFIVSGLALMIGFTLFSLASHYFHVQEQKKLSEADQPYAQLMEMKEHIDTQDEAEILTADVFGESLKDGNKVPSSPQFFFQEWFEVFRSLASGLSKGYNFSGFAGSSMQEMDEQGHYHDTHVMAVLAGINAVLFSMVLGLRALARGLGRPPLGQVRPGDAAKTDEKAASTMENTEPELAGESSETKKKMPDSLPRNESFLSHFSIFSKRTTPKAEKQSLLHSRSETALNQLNAAQSTIQGLE